MDILLIAGHGAGDPGATGNGYKEADLTREVVAGLKPILSRYVGVDVYNTQKKMSNYLANGGRFDFTPYRKVYEVHFNALKGGKSDGKIKGSEILVHSSILENKDVAVKNKAVAVENKILGNLERLGFTNRGVKPRDDLIVMNTCKKQGVPYALIEVTFIDDPDDMKLYKQKEKEVIKAIADGIIEGHGWKKEADELTKADVIAIIKEYEAEKAKAQGGTWSAEAWKKAKSAGIMDGSAPQSPATREQVAVILDRLKLLD